MAIHSKDETLMCKVFPSSLRPITMRWFDGLKAESINSFHELTQAFGSRFVTCRRVPRLLASLLSLSMQEGENLKAYFDRYQEMFNKIEGDFNDVAISTFKLGLLAKHGLKKSLTGKPVTNVCQFMDRIDKDFAGQSRSANLQLVNAMFREPVYQVQEKIKNEPFFKQPSKIVGNPERRNHNLYCQYHQDHGHTTEDCRSLWDHLDQLVREGRTRSCPTRVMSVARLFTEDTNQDMKRGRMETQPVLGFLDEDKIGAIQPHDDALLVTLRIGGYDVKRVMVDQSNEAEIMYPDLYKGLNLKLENLTPYISPLVSFDGKVIILKGQIRLPVQTGP
nr:uncharacterized protein LOC111993839 [Quercus suber]